MELKDIDLNLLTALGALLQHRNVTRAARQLGVTQPAMSNTLARLRKWLGDPLLVRTPSGMAPTPRAAALAGPVAQALDELQRALRSQLAFEPATSTATFRISGTDQAGLFLLPTLTRRIREEAPRVEIRMAQNHGEFPRDALREGALDLVIGRFPNPGADIFTQALLREHYVVLLRGGHPLLRGRWDEQRYAAAEHLAVAPRAGSRGVVDAELEKKGLVRHVALTVPWFLAAPFVVAESDLIATVPERIARHFTPLLGLEQRPVPLPLAPYTISQHWHERMNQDPAHRWLRAQIHRALHDVDGADPGLSPRGLRAR